MTGARITRVETAAIRAVGPSVLVRIWAGDTHGVGECYPSGPAGAIVNIVRSFEEHLVGEDARDVERLAETLRRWHIFTGAQGGAIVTAISGVEIALWDLAGKLQGVPIYRLLGGAFRTTIPLYADLNAGTVDAAGHHAHGTDRQPWLAGDSPAASAQAATSAIAAGYQAIKFDIDDVHGPLHRDPWNGAIDGRELVAMVEKVAAVRDAVGPEIDLAIDMHGRFNVTSAIRVAQAMEPFNLMWLEEPTPPENIHALADVRRKTRTPICAGENLYTRFQFKELIDADAVDVVMPDLAKCGGLAEGKRIANLAELSYLPFSPHNVSGPIGTIAMAHVCAAVVNFTYLEFHAVDLTHWPDFVHWDGPIVNNGSISLTERPGLGLTLDESSAFEHRHTKGGISFFGKHMNEVSS